MIRTQKTLVIALALVVVAAVVLGVSRIGGSRRRALAHRPLERPFWCETCSKEFMASVRGITAVCPTCHEETSIIRQYYVCKACGERFFAFDVDTQSQAARLEGGDWEYTAYTVPRPFECPNCSLTDTAPEKYQQR